MIGYLFDDENQMFPILLNKDSKGNVTIKTHTGKIGTVTLSRKQLQGLSEFTKSHCQECWDRKKR